MYVLGVIDVMEKISRKHKFLEMLIKKFEKKKTEKKFDNVVISFDIKK